MEFQEKKAIYLQCSIYVVHCSRNRIIDLNE